MDQSDIVRVNPSLNNIKNSLDEGDRIPPHRPLSSGVFFLQTGTFFFYLSIVVYGPGPSVCALSIAIVVC